MIPTIPKLPLLALALSSVLAGVANAGHEIVDHGKNQVPIEEPRQTFGGSVSAGYWSKYIFRGSNLTPSSDGIIWADAKIHWSPWEGGTFTLGGWAGSQQGTAQVPGVERIGEGGGGAKVDFGGTAITGDALVDFVASQFALVGAPLPREQALAILNAAGFGIPQDITKTKTNDTAVQNRFTEIDVYAEYRHDFGPIEVAIGNIFFYIDRDSEDVFVTRQFFASEDARQLIEDLSNLVVVGPGGTTQVVPARANHPEDILNNFGRKTTTVFKSTGDEQFDRVYAEVSTNLWAPFIKPRIVYYHTVYNEGDEGAKELFTDRYDTKGGYLEAKVDGSIPLWKTGGHGVTDYKTGVVTGADEHVRLSLDPHARVSYSFRDRADQDGSPLTGWNHVQFGAELVWHVTDTFRVVPEVNYMHHLSDPTPGTERDAWWGGGKVEVVF